MLKSGLVAQLTLAGLKERLWTFVQLSHKCATCDLYKRSHTLTSPHLAENLIGA